MAVTVFPRQRSFTRPVFLTGPKIGSAIGHILIGLWIYLILTDNVGGRLVKFIYQNSFGYTEEEADTYVTPVSGDRIPFLVLFSTIYGLRWGLLGAFTTNAGNSMPWDATIQVVVLHTLFCILTMTVFTTIQGGVPAELNELDYMAFGLSQLAGVLQHGSELQRLLFKMDPKNKGKLHTTGLFGYARFINHTGHILQDLAVAIAVRSYGVAILVLGGVFLIFFQITPETEEHMQAKYKGKYKEYCKQTPYKFIPYIW